MLEPRSVELHELSDHTLGAQHLHHRQHEVSGGGTFFERTRELETHHLRDQHRDRLAEHGRLGLDATHAPAEHRQAVDHGRVAVCTDQRVRIGQGLAVFIHIANHLRKVFEVHLVADTRARRYHAQVLEGLLSPAQELVALLVTRKFHSDVLFKGLP